MHCALCTVHDARPARAPPGDRFERRLNMVTDTAPDTIGKRAGGKAQRRRGCVRSDGARSAAAGAMVCLCVCMGSGLVSRQFCLRGEGFALHALARSFVGCLLMD